MRDILILILIGGFLFFVGWTTGRTSGATERRLNEEAAWQAAKEKRAQLAAQREAVRVAPPVEPEPELEPKRLPEIAQNMYEMGRETERLYQELDPMAKTTVFMYCLERETGEEMRGPDLERHIRRNSKESQVCKKELTSMTDEAIREKAMAFVEAKKGKK